MLNLKQAVLIAGAITAMGAEAHRAWLLPSSTQLSGDDAWVTFDAAISNTLFHVDHVAMAVDGIEVIGPDMQKADIQNASLGRYRSTFDLELLQEGTYRIERASGNLSASWEDASGARGTYPGRGQAFNEEEFATAIPAGATNVTVSSRHSRVETFVTLGSPSAATLEASREGLEIRFETHPNDLYADESARFQFLMDGDPAAGTEVQIVPSGMRYRNNQMDLNLVADKQGWIEVQWPIAGMYFIEASYQDDKAAAPATSRQGSYSATVEVLPL